MDIDLPAVKAAVARQHGRVTPGIDRMAEYHAKQVPDEDPPGVIGPLLPGSGASGVVMHRGREIAAWGDPSVPEMAFSATKSVLSMVAGLAFDRGLLEPHAQLPDLPVAVPPEVTWHRLLQQTSQWDGELWGKQAGHRGLDWEYNDVRVNLLALALTVVLREPLADVLAERLLDPLGASDTWSWHGYDNATVEVGGRTLPAVSGGAHWGGGLWISAHDLALLGELCLRGGGTLLSDEWLRRSWLPCEVKPEYGYLWWLNDEHRLFPSAPVTGRCARGNNSRHLLWIDPARELVIASHWGDDVGELLRDVSTAVPAAVR